MNSNGTAPEIARARISHAAALDTTSDPHALNPGQVVQLHSSNPDRPGFDLLAGLGVLALSVVSLSSLF